MALTPPPFPGGPKPLTPNMPVGLQVPPLNNINTLNIEPTNLSGWQLIGKTLLGGAIGLIIAVLLFIVLSFLGGMFTEALGQGAQTTRPNVLLPLILLFIGFISTFIGNIAVAGIYNLFFSRTYYQLSKTFGLLLLTNGILFFILAPLYLLFSKDIETLFLILGFHVVFSVFISSCEIEFVSNPNYSSSALVGNIIGFTLTIVGYFLIFELVSPGATKDKVSLFMLLPSIVAYTLMPLGVAIRTKIYYKVYEMGNNPFYLPSVEDGGPEAEAEKKDDEINITV